MASHPQPGKAIELLGQLAPRDALERAHDLAQQMERDEYVRKYIASRGLMVAGVGAGATACCLLIVMALLSQIDFEPLAPWVRITLLLFGFSLWLGGTLGLMYWLLSTLQRSALTKQEKEENPR